ncbi:MAG: LysR substrate-binding domain-containing protein [Kineosporiaceae bacterium]
MNLRDLEYLVAVADHRHFGRAAAACFVSQPTLSTQLKKLEAELGVALVERRPRGVILTRAGEEILARARRILREADAVRTIARRARSPRTGSLRLGIFPTIAPYLLPHVVRRLHDELPDLELLLTEDKSGPLLAQLQAGALDAVVLALPVDQPGLEVVPLFREDFVLAVPADLPEGSPLLRLSEPVSAAAVAGQPLLVLEEGHCLREQVLAWCRLDGDDRLDGFRATSLETLRHMVAAGVGATLLPLLAVCPPVPASPDVRLLRFADPAPYRDLVLVSRPTGVHAELLPELAGILRSGPGTLVRPLGPTAAPAR